MATYKEIINYIKNKHGFTIKTCWIAHVKKICGCNPKIALNRISLNNRVNPCLKEKLKPIKDALRHFGMVE